MDTRTWSPSPNLDSDPNQDLDQDLDADLDPDSDQEQGPDPNPDEDPDIDQDPDSDPDQDLDQDLDADLDPDQILCLLDFFIFNFFSKKFLSNFDLEKIAQFLLHILDFSIYLK